MIKQYRRMSILDWEVSKGAREYLARLRRTPGGYRAPTNDRYRMKCKAYRLIYFQERISMA